MPNLVLKFPQRDLVAHKLDVLDISHEVAFVSRAEETKRFNLKVVGGIAAVILVIGLANLHNSAKQAPVAKWTGTGVYAAIFDNVHDELELGRVQCFEMAPGPVSARSGARLVGDEEVQNLLETGWAPPGVAVTLKPSTPMYWPQSFAWQVAISACSSVDSDRAPAETERGADHHNGHRCRCAESLVIGQA